MKKKKKRILKGKRLCVCVCVLSARWVVAIAPRARAPRNSPVEDHFSQPVNAGDSRRGLCQ